MDGIVSASGVEVKEVLDFGVSKRVREKDQQGHMMSDFELTYEKFLLFNFDRTLPSNRCVSSFE